jgi:hypothetical protein
MLRLKDPNHVPSNPKNWTEKTTGRRIEWRSEHETFGNFLTKIFAFCDGNQLSRPSQEEVEDHVCRQMAGWACTGKPADKVLITRSASGCKSCGGGH